MASVEEKKRVVTTQVKARIRVGPKSVTDDDLRWQTAGRPHYLHRDIFQAKANQPAALETITVTEPPEWTNALLPLGLILAALYALWQYTVWTMPVLPRLLRPLNRMFRHLIRHLWLRAFTKPVREYGLGVTLWCWWVALTILAGCSSLVQGRLLSSLGALPLLGVAVIWWFVLRWWRLRRFQPRPLPRRRM